MGKITLELVRKCAEHNEGELSTLEELSLHQRDIEKIEHLHRWCPRLRILLLQGNLISKIENVHRLRELEYLNLALNNLEEIVGLERCEALTKLDLTANFIIRLTSLAALQDLAELRELYLTGNPCVSFRGYRSWVICLLPQLEELDGLAITRSERLKALQEFTHVDATIREDERKAIEKRAIEQEVYQREEAEKKEEEKDMTDEEWWNSSSEHTPESRLALHRELQERREREEESDQKSKKPRSVKLFTNDGRPLNVNSGKLEFNFKEDEKENCFILEVQTYKYLDPSLVSCDVEPWYVRVSVKKKMLQLVLLEEVRPGQSSAKRSSISGHLIITMPKLLSPRMPYVTPASRQVISLEGHKRRDDLCEKGIGAFKDPETKTETNFLEIGDTNRSVDYTRIVDSEKKNRETCAFSNDQFKRNQHIVPERPNSPGFIDDDGVPPLE